MVFVLVGVVVERMRASSLDRKHIECCGLSSEVVKALKLLEYENLTEVQEQVIPLALEGKDMIVRSQTGSGKTAAFAIPLCEKITLEQRSPQVLVLTPTRELAVQLKQDISSIGRFKRIRCVAIFGRQPVEVQKRDLRQRVHVIVGTPGRIFDHIQRKNIDLTDIKYLIIDEADKMLEMGFIDQVEAIVSLLPTSRVTMLFSATMPDKIEEVCKSYMINPIRIEVNSEKPTTEMIHQVYFEVEETDKFRLTRKLLDTSSPDSCMLFCNTREKVESVYKKINGERYSCGTLHGGLEQRERLHIVQSFKNGDFPLLIATDVAARGIHIDDMPLVINYDVPVDEESYVHRIGRTGRIGKEGTAITFVTSKETALLHKIEKYIGYRIEKQAISTIDEGKSGKLTVEQPSQANSKPKNCKSDSLNGEFTRIRINAGKKTKMRAGDILGAIINIDGVSAAEIGIIDIQDTCSYVEILGDKGELVLEALQNTKIKGKIYTTRKVALRGY